DHLLERRVEAELLQVEPTGLAAALVDLHHLGHRLGELAPHPHLERALARETKGDTHTSAVHFITAEPQVRPAPMPVISTVSPCFTRPVASASCSASGIEAEDVLP